MPSVSSKQQRYMGMEYAAAKEGKPTQTGLSVKKLRELARKPKRGYVR